MPEIVTSFQPFENPKKPLKIMAHCDIAPRFLPTKIREDPLLEFFGVKERVDEVDAKHEGDAEADNGLIHGALPSKICAGARIGADQHK